MMLSVPLPIIGTLIGGAVGCFLGALIGELSVTDNVVHGARVGLFAAIGQVLGAVSKTVAAMLMAGVAVCETVLAGS